MHRYTDILKSEYILLGGEEFSRFHSLEAPLLTLLILPTFGTSNKLEALQAQDSAKHLKSPKSVSNDNQELGFVSFFSLSLKVMAVRRV